MKIKPLVIEKMVDNLEIEHVKKEAQYKGNCNYLVAAIIFILPRNFKFKSLRTGFKFKVMKSVKFISVKYGISVGILQICRVRLLFKVIEALNVYGIWLSGFDPVNLRLRFRCPKTKRDSNLK